MYTPPKSIPNLHYSLSISMLFAYICRAVTEMIDRVPLPNIIAIPYNG